MPGNELETGGEGEGQLQQISSQKTGMPVNEPEDVITKGQAPIEEQTQGQTSSDTTERPLVIVETTRSANERQKKTAKKGESRIKDHEALANKLEENLMSVKARLQSSQGILKDTRNKLSASKKDIKKTKAQLTAKKRDLAACRRELQEFKRFGRDMKEANRDLQNHLAASQVELSECKDDLFSLQTVTQIPDSFISKLFESLSQQIVSWIDSEVAAFQKAHSKAEWDHIFLVGADEYAATFLRLHPGAGEHLARYLIHRFLQDHVFGKEVYFFGLPEEDAQLLRTVEQNWAEPGPRGNSETRARWRFEALRVLVSTTVCIEYGNKQAQDLNSRLFKELSEALPTLFSGMQTHATFYDRVLLPAVKLANTVRMSTSDYVLSIPELPFTAHKPIITDLLKVHKMLDLESGRHLKPDSAVVANKDGVIGDFVLCLEPGLSRVIKGKETTLRQAIFLVKLNHPLGKRSKAST